MSVRQISKIVLVWDLLEQSVPKERIANHVGVHRRTIIRWHQGILEAGGIENFLDDYLSAKKGERAKRKVDGLLKKRVWKIREGNNHCCGQKIKYFLKKDYNLKLGTTTIYKILSEKYQLRSKWKKNQKRGSVPKAGKPREVIQMDTVDFGNVFAFCAVDICSREVDVMLKSSLTAVDGQSFLHTSMNRRFNGFSKLIQTDGGSEFKAEFKKDVTNYCDRHRYARPYKKNEQSYIESFNRSLRKECLGWSKYKKNQIPSLTTEINNWLVYYHYTRPHIGLGMRPPLTKKV
jgi:transposase InsO family protein